VDRGFTCRPGEILNALNTTEEEKKIPRCLQCAAGTYSSPDMKKCLPCQLGWYQDMNRQPSCRQCPEGTFTKSEGSKSVSECIPVCGYGTYSPTGMVPCITVRVHLGIRPALEMDKIYSFCTLFYSVPKTPGREYLPRKASPSVKVVLLTPLLTRLAQRPSTSAKSSALLALILKLD